MRTLVVVITFGLTIGLILLFGKSNNKDTTVALAELPFFSSALTAPPAASSTPNAIATPVLSQRLPATTPKIIDSDWSKITILTVTSEVKTNSLAQIKIQTLPLSRCAIKFILPSGTQSSSSALGDTVTDDAGIAFWTWRINWNTKPGDATVTVTCQKDKQTFSRPFQIKII